jgi:hypothetical protein
MLASAATRGPDLEFKMESYLVNGMVVLFVAIVPNASRNVALIAAARLFKLGVKDITVEKPEADDIGDPNIIPPNRTWIVCRAH